jgi:hypothetical protein
MLPAQLTQQTFGRINKEGGLCSIKHCFAHTFAQDFTAAGTTQIFTFKSQARHLRVLQ